MKDLYIIVPGWEKFQHYKDRDPTWIKTYVDLLDRDEYMDLTGVQRSVLHGLWLLYARRRNANGVRIKSLRRGLNLKVTEAQIGALVKAGFIELSEVAEEVVTEKWPSRYIPQELRDSVLERDQNRCKSCGSENKLEIDHIVPVSQGGVGVYENLQVLCRSCNRGKRAKSAEQPATQNGEVRSPELEAETEEERDLLKGDSQPQHGAWKTASPTTLEAADRLAQSVNADELATLTIRRFASQLPEAAFHSLREKIQREGKAIHSPAGYAINGLRSMVDEKQYEPGKDGLPAFLENLGGTP